MRKRNYFHSGSHPWPQIYRRTADGTNWHEQEERYRRIERRGREILDRMDGAGCIGWGIAAAVVALAAAVAAFVMWS